MSDPIILMLGDCLERMRELPDESVDAVVTDPPYGLEFMGKEWDSIARRQNHPLDPSMTITAGEPQKGNPWTSERSGYGAPKKNPRCRRCGRLRFGQEKWRCGCDEPDWDTRTAEYANVMQAWHEAWAAEAFRVAKPGAHLLAFGGTRTYHRLASAIEDAGWEIRDCLVWAYASGFPKSLDVSKAIDKAAGAEREKVPVGKPVKRIIPGADQNATGSWIKDNGREYQPGPELAATDAAKQWQGWGTALKPAWEPIVMARKPLRGTVAANVQRWGTGAINVDATRIPSEGHLQWAEPRDMGYHGGTDAGPVPAETNQSGRWPANVLLTGTPIYETRCTECRWRLVMPVGWDPIDHLGEGCCANCGSPQLVIRHSGDVAIFDGDVPGVVGGGIVATSSPATLQEAHPANEVYGTGMGHKPSGYTLTGYGDSGTYSRFFLIPKAARSDREPLLPSDLPLGDKRWNEGPLQEHGIETGTGRVINRLPRRNQHPTVKPLELMRHLVRLVTPPTVTSPDGEVTAGTVLDPFLGSGTTAIAAQLEGFRCIGIEKEPEYMRIAEARLNGRQVGLGLDVDAPQRKRGKTNGHWPKARTPGKDGWGFSGQTGLEERFDAPEDAA